MGAAEEVVAHIREYIHDQKHFSARWLSQIKTNSGLEIEVELIAQIFGGIVSVALLHGEQAQFLANFLLILVPFVITYVYPKERPPINLLLIYWGTYSSLTLLDNGLHNTLPAYYVVKIVLMSLLFLKPFCGAQKIQEMLEKSKIGIDSSDRENDSNAFNEDELRAFQKARKKKSPPPEKPEGEDIPSSKTDS
uniref:Uncharacterized protein n=1 Tax=Panagrolaimus sp. JU765 TaxID=591449 RepID=A0AC34Q1I2_9BILA